ncbi:ABC transporter ATP-binding protein [Ketogulonicigenium vulgare]|uniref:Oligopeptide/dipeptide ABC transporter, ATPase subunit n=1 Tax=Ketogulonicigenium vulgare (strain WSH-001) TaxID=759362 RepID=F9Y5X8_KETVW|nr:oligopeptide/dipeptide ABC transporter ATP-binding protein [Ketogulonicigenium vulgare]ADO42612.1 oligopeptide ABC transporter ATP binding protein [Ketogulonicigenium vulgare Y25]AEM40803.1 Oligopeptide/dipeptide ABC transporter, ATPase subunit [Ketogulonicigenium vulgare WSH-001]ALJ80968.1 peptide ABC transporter ATP-binding protein [Ketogulonicigenium vulgare]ANW33733.1 peptide ABC transporter ATP-binding protein [Ketogulonicigenium vulgare]AOZ54521.1 oligopeptide ABC transporter ATP bind
MLDHTDAPLFEARGLSKSFRAGGHITGKKFNAVKDASLKLYRGETLGIVGESGCGKSTLARMLVGLEVPDGGDVLLRGQALVRDKASRRAVQMVFQDPYLSLNPRLTVMDIIAEPLDVHGLARGAARKARVGELLDAVGLDPQVSSRFPHEFSGGQRQRIGIARALAADPQILVCDEPVSALDVSVQAQVVNLLIDLQARFGLSIIFIAHDLAVVRAMCHRTMVMYMGRVVEVGDTDTVMQHPNHPYTQMLRRSALEPDPRAARLARGTTPKGEPPNPANLPQGCVFQSRCPLVFATCHQAEPDLLAVGDQGKAACWHLEAR